MHTLRHHPLLRRLISVVLLALLLAQGTSLVHAIAHAPGSLVPQAVEWLAGSGETSTSTSASTSASADFQTSAASSRLSHWGHPAGAPQCQVFEALLLGQAPCMALPTLATLDLRQRPAAEPLSVAVALRTPRSYEARAPPRG
ncbi:MAG: hypothetical protein ABIN96_09580 [Rubrivivax sp.]